MKHLQQKVILGLIPLIYLVIFLSLRSEYRQNFLAVQHSVYPLLVLGFTIVSDVLLTISLLVFNSHLWANVFAGVLFVLSISLYNLFHAKLGLFCNPSGLIFSMCASYVAAYLVKYLLRRSNRRLVNAIVGAYFSRNTRLKLADTFITCEPIVKPVTILECSVLEYERLIEGLTPKELFSQINHVLDIVINSIMKNGGRVDKFLGTKIYAYWENPEDSYLAIKSAMEAFEELKMFKHGSRLKIRMGVHYSDVMIGLLGTSKVMNYSIVSSALDTVEEIVKAADLYDKNILMSRAVYKQCWRDISAVKAATLNLRGDVINTELFEPLEIKKRNRIKSIFEIEKDD